MGSSREIVREAAQDAGPDAAHDAAAEAARDAAADAAPGTAQDRAPVAAPEARDSVSVPLVAEYRAVQDMARQVLAELAPSICPDDTETSIAQRAVESLRAHGITETWYHHCPALVLLGTRSTLSISGRDYEPAREPVGETNLVTIDLSPKRGTARGDCARSFFIEGGRVTDAPRDKELSRGKTFLDSLHAVMPRFVTRATTFHDLFEWTNAHIASAGFENLDFLRNVGHSIATGGEPRRFIEAGNHARLSETPFFTFEPHVRALGGRWGFKHENIFFFDRTGRLEEL
jgi:Xaa-Pro aminopeptidase